MRYNSVSVIIPVYNSGKFLESAVNSVLDQEKIEGVQLEIILVDDYSDDEFTLTVLQRLSLLESIYVHRMPRNQGPSAARNAGVKHSSKEIIAFLDSDDVWTKTSLNKRLTKLSENTEVNCVIGLYYYKVGERLVSGETHKLACLTDSLNSGCSQIIENIESEFYHVTPFSLGASLFTKQSFLEMGGLFEHVYIGEDWLFWLQYLKSNKALFISDIAMLATRGHESLMSGEKAIGLSSIKVDMYALFLISGLNKKEVWWRLSSNINSLTRANISLKKKFTAFSYSILGVTASLYSKPSAALFKQAIKLLFRRIKNDTDC